jgi:hypothetical protein
LYSLWASLPNWPALVVGNVDLDGSPAPDCQIAAPPAPNIYQNAKVDVWAPGVNIPVSGRGNNGALSGVSIGKCSSNLESNSDCATAAATVSGLVAYFLGVTNHRQNILDIQAKLLGNNPTWESGLAWGLAVKDYVDMWSHIRCTAVPLDGFLPNTIWNGEIPLDNNANPIGPVGYVEPVLPSAVPGPNGKRQNVVTPGILSCPANFTAPTWRFIVPVFPDINDTNGQQNYGLINNFTLRLKAETNPDTLWVSSDSTNWTSFWIQQLNNSQVDEYINDPAVSAIRILIDSILKTLFLIKDDHF